MANAFLRGMAKIGLVELEPSATPKDEGSELTMEEVDKILAEEDAASGSVSPSGPAANVPAPRPKPAPMPTSSTDIGTITEGDDFEQIYREAQVPASAYSAEKLLRVLDGLKAMEPQVRQSAVMAMDAADEEWSVADAVLDAQRKIKVLTSHREQISTALAGIQSQAQQEKQKRDDYLKHAREQIMAKIADLQTQLESETAKMLTEQTEIDGAVFAAEQAHQREVHRLSIEAGRLSEIPHTFAVQRDGTGATQ